MVAREPLRAIERQADEPGHHARADFDVAMARLRVEPEDPHAGRLAVVVRTALGRLAWHVWPITAR